MRCSQVLGLLVLVGACSTSPATDINEKRKLDELEYLLKRVIGGTELEEGKWPWLVAMTGKIPTRTFFGITITSERFFCGASLIAEKWVLTAAHCFPENLRGGLNPEYWKLRFGDTDRESSLWDDFRGWIGDRLDKDNWKDWVITAEQIFIHPGYNPNKKWENDIALVKLSEPVPHKPDNVEAIQAVKLQSPAVKDFPKDGQKCIFKGWGCTRGGGGVTNVAYEVELPKVNDRSCAILWGIQTQTRLCAGHNLGGMGICPGDSGGPLVCRQGNEWLQVGIASFTAAHAPANYPGAFTRVSAYYDWIQQVMNKFTDKRR